MAWPTTSVPQHCPYFTDPVCVQSGLLQLAQQGPAPQSRGHAQGSELCSSGSQLYWITGDHRYVRACSTNKALQLARHPSKFPFDLPDPGCCPRLTSTLALAPSSKQPREDPASLLTEVFVLLLLMLELLLLQ